MLSFLAGEFSNSAKYFTKFANVNSENYRDYNNLLAQIGNLFLYRKRVDDSIKVAKKDHKIRRCNKTIKSDILYFKCRQGEITLVKHFIDTAKCEPLHLENNVCKELFVKLWKVLFACNSFNRCKSYKDIPSSKQ